MAFDRLIKRIDELHNPSVAGLDPRLEYVPQFIQDASFVKLGHTLEAAADAILQFNKALIDALYDVVPAIKPQAAYYEMYGWAGVRTLAETIRYAQSKGMFVMTDGKRNDIGATMTAYATAHLGKVDVDGVELEPFGADALTVNGYLGTDGIQPLLDVCEKYDKGIFVLAKTSNPSSGELQDRLIDGKPVYEMGQQADRCLWLFRSGCCGRCDLSGTAGGTPEKAAAYAVPGAGIRCTGRRCTGRCRCI